MFTSKLKAFLADESGATAIEYGLIAGLVSVAAITALGAMGDSLIEIFEVVQGELETAAASASGEGGGGGEGEGSESTDP